MQVRDIHWQVKQQLSHLQRRMREKHVVYSRLPVTRDAYNEAGNSLFLQSLVNGCDIRLHTPVRRRVNSQLHYAFKQTNQPETLRKLSMLILELLLDYRKRL